MDVYVAAYCLVVGVAVLGLWTFLFARGQVPEVRTAPRSLAFHVTAEVVMAAVLLSGAWSLWRGTAVPAIVWLGLGMVIYSTLNSAGYYAQRRVWAPVALFVVLLAGAVVAALRMAGAG